MSDRLSAERIEQIRSTTRRDVICPGAPVKGGCHQWTAAGPHWQCGACGHIIPRCQHLPDVADLLGEVEQLRNVDEELEDAGKRFSDLQDEHQRQAAAWDKECGRLRAGWDAAVTRLADQAARLVRRGREHSADRAELDELRAERDRLQRELDAERAPAVVWSVHDEATHTAIAGALRDFCWSGYGLEEMDDPDAPWFGDLASHIAGALPTDERDEPLRLHHSPQDVELSDDGGAVLMLTHSGGRPAVLELTADQAAALRDDLADCGRDPDPRGIGDTT
jgi:hypothetical protein